MSKHPLEQLSAGERYEAEVIGRLRYRPRPADDDPEIVQESAQAAAEAALEYATDIAATHVDRVQEWIDTVDHEDEGAVSEYPSLVLEELAYTASRIADMEAYRDRLLIFARLFAFDPRSSRQIAQVAGLSYSSVLRAATDEDTDDVQRIAASEAADFVRQLHASRTNPQLMETYARLRAIAGPTTTKETDG